MTQKMVEEGGGDELGPFWRGCDASTKTEKTWEFEQTGKGGVANFFLENNFTLRAKLLFILHYYFCLFLLILGGVVVILAEEWGGVNI